MIFGGRGMGAREFRVVAGSRRSPPGGLPSQRMTRSIASAPPAITESRSSKPGAAEADHLTIEQHAGLVVASSLNSDKSQIDSPELIYG